MFELDRKDQKQKRQKELVGPVWTLGSQIVLDQKNAMPLRRYALGSVVVNPMGGANTCRCKSISTLPAFP